YEHLCCIRLRRSTRSQIATRSVNSLPLGFIVNGGLWKSIQSRWIIGMEPYLVDQTTAGRKVDTSCNLASDQFASRQQAKQLLEDDFVSRTVPAPPSIV